jgi:hypothetical protein
VYRIPLRSKKGVDYRRLRNYLRDGQWRKADQETDRVMLKAADREKQRYLDIDDIKSFPCQDLQTIDQLWVAASKGRFGFSVQKRIWQECGSPTSLGEEWDRFCVKVGWKNQQATAYVPYDDYKFDPLISQKGGLPGARCGVWDIVLSFLGRLVECSR